MKANIYMELSLSEMIIRDGKRRKKIITLPIITPGRIMMISILII